MQVYYVTYMQGKMTVEKMTPYAFLKYKRQGFRFSVSGIIESPNAGFDNKNIDIITI